MVEILPKAKRRIRKSSSISRNCLVCGKQFFASRKWQIYCGEGCKRRAEILTRKSITRSRFCKGCGELIDSRRRNADFCSKCDFEHGDIWVLKNGKWQKEVRP